MQLLLPHLGRQLPIVSVGSGMGVEEQALIDLGYNVTCVDPTTQRRDRYSDRPRVRVPDYPTVHEYLAAHPRYEGQIHLLLHYPLPDYCLYDIAAIHDLRPKMVTVMATKGGSAGSFLLQVWLRLFGVPTQGKLATEYSWRKAGRDLDVLGIDAYRLIRCDDLPVSELQYLSTNIMGVANHPYVATLRRVDCYRRAGVLRSPRVEERLYQGMRERERKVRCCAAYVDQLSAVLEEESEEEGSERD